MLVEVAVDDVFHTPPIAMRLHYSCTNLVRQYQLGTENVVLRVPSWYDYLRC